MEATTIKKAATEEIEGGLRAHATMILFGFPSKNRKYFRIFILYYVLPLLRQLKIYSRSILYICMCALVCKSRLRCT